MQKLVKNLNIIWNAENSYQGLCDILVEDGVIVKISPSITDIDADVDVVDMNGAYVMPAFWDAHIHVLASEIMRNSLVSLNEEGKHSVEEYLKKIRDYACSDIGKQFDVINGAGWEDATFMAYNQKDGEEFKLLGPSRFLLDEALKGTPAENKPAYFSSFDYHSIWVNTVALKMAGMLNEPENTPIPSGKIEVSPIDEKAWGCLREGATRYLYDNVTELKIPDSLMQQALEEFECVMLKNGITGVTAVGCDPSTLCSDPSVSPMYDLFVKNDKEGKLNLFYDSCAYIAPMDDYNEVIARIKSLQELHKDSKNLRFSTLKIFVDGVVEGGTAALIDENGMCDKANLIWDEEHFKNMVIAADKAGLQMHFHSIGDGATKLTLDAIEEAFRLNGKRDARHTIAHAQIVRDEDIERFNQLGIIASMQPAWFYKDPKIFDKVERVYLGDRADKEYYYKSFIDKSVCVAAGSDYPITTDPNPLYAVETGVTRSANGVTDDAYKLNVDECGSLADLLKSHSYSGAYQAHVENKMGSIAIGMRANFVVLSENPFECESNNIHQIKIIATLVDGKIVYKQ